MTAKDPAKIALSEELKEQAAYLYGFAPSDPRVSQKISDVHACVDEISRNLKKNEKSGQHNPLLTAHASRLDDPKFCALLSTALYSKGLLYREGLSGNAQTLNDLLSQESSSQKNEALRTDPLLWKKVITKILPPSKARPAEMSVVAVSDDGNEATLKGGGIVMKISPEEFARLHRPDKPTKGSSRNKAHEARR